MLVQTTSPPRYYARTTLWAFCILSAFVVTHMPPPARPAPMLINDKLLHFVGFFVLGLLTVWRLGDGERRLRWPAIAGWYAFLIIYGIFDEGTQELVGRSFEWTDWLADCSGAMVGMLICVIFLRYDSSKTQRKG